MVCYTTAGWKEVSLHIKIQFWSRLQKKEWERETEKERGREGKDKIRATKGQALSTLISVCRDPHSSPPAARRLQEQWNNAAGLPLYFSLHSVWEKERGREIRISIWLCKEPSCLKLQNPKFKLPYHYKPQLSSAVEWSTSDRKNNPTRVWEHMA